MKMRIKIVFLGLLFLFFWKISLFPQGNINFLSKLKIFYWDSLTQPDKPIYRELVKIGDHDYFSKPQVINILVEYDNLIPRGRIEVLLEELQVSTEINGTNLPKLKEKSWVLIKVLDSWMSDNLKSPVRISNVPYQTAYFYNSVCYLKFGFRIRAVYLPDDGGKKWEISREYLFPK